jgi:hypothetical protein
MYVLRFFFDYGGTCLWAANDAARARFGYAVDPADLPIADELKGAVIRACGRFDTSVDWEYPPAPSPWSKQEWEQFDCAAARLLDQLRAALGATFEVRDERAGFGHPG